MGLHGGRRAVSNYRLLRKILPQFMASESMQFQQNERSNLVSHSTMQACSQFMFMPRKGYQNCLEHSIKTHC
jgi:hypothetical protein